VIGVPSVHTRRLAVLALGCVVVAALAVAQGAGDGDDGHLLRVELPSAVGASAGLPVRLAGVDVGRVEHVDVVAGRAVLRLRVDRHEAWPLPGGTAARVRSGPVATFNSRFIELLPGDGGTPLPDGAVLVDARAIPSVELDDVYRLFDRRTRDDVRGLIRVGGSAIDGVSAEIGPGIAAAADGTAATAAVVRELGADPAALRELVTSTARLSGALRRTSGQLGSTVAHAGRTLESVANRREQLRSTLRRLPPALEALITTLPRLDDSLGVLSHLVDDVRDGARLLPSFASSADGAVRAVDDVAPLATSALRAGRASAPAARRFIAEATPFVRDAGRVLTASTPLVRCVRPYTPEIAALFSTWAGFSTNYDAAGHYARGLVFAPPMGGAETRTPEQVVKSSAGLLRYAFPAPPGANVAEPWFQPECGITPDGLDASKDPETP
jgi:phospholipid/cholesterol/gamma-HCH transport system substrate-binding protein